MLKMENVTLLFVYIKGNLAHLMHPTFRTPE